MKSATKNCWILVLIVAAALVGLFLGRSAGKNAAENEIAQRLSDGNMFFGLGTGQEGKLQTIMDLINRCYVDEVNIDSMQDVVIPMMLKELDPHCMYIPRKDVEKVAGELKSNFGGIGVQFNLRDDTVSVVSVISGGPSSALGVLPGDKIIKVNGYDFTGEWMTNQTVLDSLRGELGTKVKITVLRNGGTTIDFDIVRDEIPLNSVVAAYEIAKGVGYLKIDRFAEKTYEEMLQGIAKLKSQGCEKLIVDLRSNSGGLLNVVQAMCNEFLERGEMIVYTEGTHQARQESRADGTGTSRDMELVVLIDEFSASASEIFAGAMQDNDRALIIGRRSFGKGLVQSEIPLQDGSAMRLTVARYHTPSGRCIQKPYDHGDDEQYYADFSNRYKSGELFTADSIKTDTTHIYHTAKGRTVYGGGGIVPDIFVAYDTASASKYLYELRAKRFIYDYAMKQVETERPKLSQMSMTDMVHSLQKKNYMDGLMTYAASHGLARPAKLDNKERMIIENEVRAYIAMSLNSDGGLYPLLNCMDPVVERALTELNAKSLY